MPPAACTAPHPAAWHAGPAAPFQSAASAPAPVASPPSAPAPGQGLSPNPAEMPASFSSGPTLPAGTRLAPPARVAATGAYKVANGLIYGPDGQPFIARGLNVSLGQVDAATLLATFPDANAIRLATTPGADPAQIAALVDPLTAAGWVVLIEDHSSSGAAYSPNGNNVLTGGALAAEASWYGGLAATYAANPRVWFGTANEPDNPSDPASIPAQERAIYDAVRAASPSAIVALEMRGGFTNDAAQASAATFATMTNVAWDTHVYNWISNNSTDPSATFAAMGAQVANAQSVRSADGQVPVLIGEYGPSSSGLSASDPGGQLTDQQVLDSHLGSFAWAWNAGTDALTSGTNTLTDFGRQVSAAFRKAAAK